MKSAMVSFAELPRVIPAIAALIAGAGVLSLGNGATAGIVYNGSPGFSQTDSFFGTYNMLPNPSPRFRPSCELLFDLSIQHGAMALAGLACGGYTMFRGAPEGEIQRPSCP